MNIFDRLFGRRRDTPDDLPDATAGRYRRRNAARAAGRDAGLTEDERAIERYRYLLRTAPPETIEEAHAEAFARLTPEQRRLVLEELSREVPERELAGVRDAEEPRALARLATRAELRRPGTLERAFGRADAGYGFGAPGVGLGGLMAGSFLGSIAGVVVGTAIADAFFLDSGYDQGFSEGFAAGEAGGDLGADLGGDFGTDVGGDIGADIGGDFGTDLGGEF